MADVLVLDPGTYCVCSVGENTFSGMCKFCDFFGLFLCVSV